MRYCQNYNKVKWELLYICVILLTIVVSGCGKDSNKGNADSKNNQNSSEPDATVETPAIADNAAVVLEVPSELVMEPGEAVKLGRVDALCYYLEQGLDPNIPLANGSTLLLEASVKREPKLVKLLLDYGADVNVQFPGNSCTPLHWATAYNNTEVVKILLEYGADPMVTDFWEKRPISYTNLDPETNYDEVRAMLIAAEEAPAEKHPLSTERKPGNIKETTDRSVLIITPSEAVELGRVEALRYYLEHKDLDPDMKPEVGSYLLLEAAKKLDTDIIGLLLDSDANINVTDPETGMTALHYAVINSSTNYDAAKLLLEHGADPLVKNKSGALPRDLIMPFAKQKTEFRKQLEEAEKTWQNNDGG